ncbi:MAG TPA: hypothetical protein VJS67_01320 [Pseudonocardiaceae bacterium]|nr:hypothetical protein [Pseudonocardiaceae bacterium]
MSYSGPVLAPLRAASPGGAHSPAVEVVKDLFEIAIAARSRAGTRASAR